MEQIANTSQIDDILSARADPPAAAGFDDPRAGVWGRLIFSASTDAPTYLRIPLTPRAPAGPAKLACRKPIGGSRMNARRGSPIPLGFLLCIR